MIRKANPRLSESNFSDQKNKLLFGGRALLVIITTFVLIFIIFLCAGLQFKGPAYLADEIGYLVKAAALAGGKIDSVSDWHSGYAIILAPFFVIFDNPARVWKGVALVNASFWALSYLINLIILRIVFPSRSDKSVILAGLISMIYPSWIGVTGYAFPSSMFTFVFMLSLLFYAKSRLRLNLWLLLGLVASSLLYWIHPVGIVFSAICVLIVAITWYLRREKITKALVYLLLPLVVVATFQFIVRPFINNLINPSGLPEFGHYTYAGSEAMIRRSFRLLEFYKELPIVLMGHIGYILVSSFGIVSFLVAYIIDKLRVDNKNSLRSIFTHQELYIPLISIISIMGMVILVTITSSGESSLRIDQWIYGRYFDMALLPIIGMSLLVPWHKKTAYISAFIVLLSGILLNIFTNSYNTIPVVNKFNIQAFWPYAIVESGKYIDWFIWGGVAIALLGVLIWANKRWLFLFILLPLAMVSMHTQQDWHKSMLSNYSYTTELYPMVTNHFAPDTTSCIGFDDSDHSIDPKRGERLRLYSFYLKNYSLLKINFAKWLDQCNGPYLTYSLDDLDFEQAQVVGREVPSGLYFVVKKSSLDQFVDYQELVPTSNFYFNLSDQDCVIRGCFDWYAREGDQAVGFPVTGEYYAGLLISKPSMLPTLYGPYTRVKQGEYLLSISARYLDFSSQQEVMQVSIVYDKGQKISKSVVVNKSEMLTESGQIKIPFSLDRDVEDLEIQIRVPDSRPIDRSIFALDSYWVEVKS